MSPTVESSVPLDKRTLRRQIRALRRSLAPQWDRGADADAIADAIADAASVFPDTLALLPQRPGGHPADGGQPCVATER